MDVFDRVAFPEFTFERLEHYSVDLPILVPANTARYLRVLDANVCDHGNSFVVAPEIAERRPLVFLSGYTGGQNEKDDAGFN